MYSNKSRQRAKRRKPYRRRKSRKSIRRRSNRKRAILRNKRTYRKKSLRRSNRRRTNRKKKLRGGMEAAAPAAGAAEAPSPAGECPICLEDPMDTPTKFPNMACHDSHKFCKECLDAHLRLSNVCPICRRPLQTEAEQNKINDDIKSFIEITGGDETVAFRHLQASNFVLDDAVDLFNTQGGDGAALITVEGTEGTWHLRRELAVNLEADLGNFREGIATEAGVPAATLQLWLDERELDDDSETLESMGVSDGSRIRCAIVAPPPDDGRQAPSAAVQQEVARAAAVVTVTRTGGWRRTLAIDLETELGDLREAIATAAGWTGSAATLRLWLDGRELVDDRATLVSMGVVDGSQIRCDTAEEEEDDERQAALGDAQMRAEGHAQLLGSAAAGQTEMERDKQMVNLAIAASMADPTGAAAAAAGGGGALGMPPPGHGPPLGGAGGSGAAGGGEAPEMTDTEKELLIAQLATLPPEDIDRVMGIVREFQPEVGAEVDLEQLPQAAISRIQQVVMTAGPRSFWR